MNVRAASDPAQHFPVLEFRHHAQQMPAAGLVVFLNPAFDFKRARIPPGLEPIFLQMNIILGIECGLPAFAVQIRINIVLRADGVNGFVVEHPNIRGLALNIGEPQGARPNTNCLDILTGVDAIMKQIIHGRAGVAAAGVGRTNPDGIARISFGVRAPGGVHVTQDVHFLRELNIPRLIT